MVKNVKYNILKKIFHNQGINDGLLFEISDNYFNLISIHKTEELANRKIKILNNSLREDNY